MKRAVLLMSVLAVGPVLAGCQNSGHHDADHMSSSATAYDRAYEATRDTDWTASPDMTDAARGTVTKGSRVFFSHAPTDGTNWQEARFGDSGTVHYVHPADFHKM